MTKVAFDAAHVTVRGTSVATYDYTAGCSDLLGVDAVVLYDETQETSLTALRRFQSRFEVIGYDNLEKRNRVLADLAPDVYYKLKYDYEDLYSPPGIFSAIHCSFDFDRPHGDVYAYVSQWLSEHVSAGRRPYVPHIVQLPDPARTFRSEWNIPDDALVLGRYGGSTSFDLEFAKAAVPKVVEARKDIWFVFINTEKFCNHERVLFRDAIVEPQEKADFIATCDAMLNARFIGETFGLAIAEFCYGNRPYLCWSGGRDKNHIHLQRNPEFIYRSGADLEAMLLRLRKDDCVLRGGPLRSFDTVSVIKDFNELFLSGRTSLSTKQTPMLYRLRRRVFNLAQRQWDRHMIGTALPWARS